MEEDFGGGQGLTKGCGAKGRRRRRRGFKICIKCPFYNLQPNYRNVKSSKENKKSFSYLCLPSLLFFFFNLTAVGLEVEGEEPEAMSVIYRKSLFGIRSPLSVKVVDRGWGWG